MLPRPPPEGLPVVLGPLGGRVEPDLLAADCALAAKEPFGTTPPFDFAVADWIRAASVFDIRLGIIFSYVEFKSSPETLRILRMRKRQMGTKQETLELSSQIKELIAKLGWTQNKLARFLYTELYELDDEDEILKFQERLKKELQRPTTKPERLKVYLDLIIRDREAEKLDVVLNRYVPQNSISPKLVKGMKNISLEIDKQIKNKHRNK